MSDDADSRFRDRLRRAVQENLAVPNTEPAPGFDIGIVDTVPVEDVLETVRAVEGNLAFVDLRVCIEKGKLFGSTSMELLARWLVQGGTPETRDMLKVLRSRKNMNIWPLVEADCSPEYLEACLGAGVTDPKVIAEGARHGISVEYLISAQD
jgi:hypothetical protein